MHSILVVNPKGGCGKSTLAINIAGYFATAGRRVALADCDPQGSCTLWLARRPEHAAPIRLIRPKARVLRHGNRKRRLRVPRNADMLVIDSPAGLTDGQIHRFSISEPRLVVPVLPSPLDMGAAEQFLIRLNRMLGNDLFRRRVATVANRVQENTLSAVKLESFLQDLPAAGGRKGPGFLTLLRQSQNYIRSAERGLSLFEFAPAATCYDREQWQPLLNWLRR